MSSPNVEMTDADDGKLGNDNHSNNSNNHNTLAPITSPTPNRSVLPDPQRRSSDGSLSSGGSESSSGSSSNGSSANGSTNGANTTKSFFPSSTSLNSLTNLSFGSFSFFSKNSSSSSSSSSSSVEPNESQPIIIPSPVSEAMQIVVQAVHEDTLGHYHLALPLYLLAIQHFQKACSDSSLDSAQKESIEAKTKEYSTRVKQLQNHFPFPRGSSNNLPPLEPPPPSLSIPLILPAHIVSITTSFSAHNNTTPAPVIERSAKAKREGRRRSTATEEEKIAKKKLYNKQYYQKKRAQSSSQINLSSLSTNSSTPYNSSSSSSSSTSSTSSTPASTRSPSNSPPDSTTASTNSPRQTTTQQTFSVMKLLNNTDVEPMKQTDRLWTQKSEPILPPLSSLNTASPTSAFQQLTKHSKSSQSPSSPFLSLLAASSQEASNSNSSDNSSHHRTRHHKEREIASSLIDMDPTIALMAPTNIIHLKPPHEKPDEMISLQTIAPTIVISLAYATDDNFVGKALDGYGASSTCYLTIAAAHSLQCVQKELESFGLSLKVFDAYRPQKAVECIYKWSQDPTDQKMKSKYYPNVDKSALFDLGYVARRSGHSRGSTVDLTIVTKKDSSPNTWEELDMGTCFDFMDELSHTLNNKIQGQARANRMLLKSLMERNGFVNYSQEWWHFTLKNETFPTSYFDFPTTTTAGR